jgi:hypothetical protein
LIPGRAKGVLCTPEGSSGALGSTNPSAEWMPEIKQPDNEADHSSQYCANDRRYPPLPPYAFMVRRGKIFLPVLNKKEKVSGRTEEKRASITLL